MISASRLARIFADLARIDSPSLHEKKVADHIISLLAPFGYAMRCDKSGIANDGNTGNLLVRIPATGPGEALAFSAHMDCVAPCEDVVPILENGVFRSSSDTVLGGDDKAGIAAILEAVFHVEEEKLPHPELHLIFTICEEAGMLGAKGVDFSLLPATGVVVLDADGEVGTVVTRAPRKDILRMRFHGRAAHAGIEPEKGISAIQMAAEAITHMRLLRIDADTVANVGHIEGGAATNIVAESAELVAEARSHSDRKVEAQVFHMRQCGEQAALKFGGSVDIAHEISYPALHVPDDSPLLRRTLEACARLGFPGRVESTGGGSDANVFAGKGLACVNLAIGMSAIHTTGEYIALEDMEKAARLCVELMRGA